MTAYKVEPTRTALADADEAILWINEEAPEESLRWYEGLLEALKSLGKTPLK
jgi:plasmid stabilization system protein ParE